MIGDAFLGIAVIADQNLIGAAYYHALARPWGPSLRHRSGLGGGALWILGDLVGLPFLAAQLIQLMREDESDASPHRRRAGRRGSCPCGQGPGPVLARRARPARPGRARRSPAPAAAADPAPAQDDEQPLWWENDPRFTCRFKPTLSVRGRPRAG